MKKYLIFAILILGFVLRIWGLDKNPVGVFGDELDVGNHATSLLQTGRDYYGQFLPTYIHSFSEWRAPLLMYVTAPFVKIFGLNEWGIRLPSAIFGGLSVLLLYLLIKNMFKNEKVAIISALFLAISPWHIQYSRAAFEISLLLFLILLSLYCLYLSQKNKRFLIISAILAGLTFYTYNVANIFIPIFFIPVFIAYKDNFKAAGRKKISLIFIILFLIMLPIFKENILGNASQRFRTIGVMNNEEMTQELILKRIDGGNGLIEKLFHNKPLSILRLVVSNYVSAFSPQFLFINGDTVFRHSIHEMGEIYWIQIPLLILGIYFLLQKGDRKSQLFWFGWLLIAPIPSSLTIDGGMHASRLSLMIVPLMVISAFGLHSLYEVKISKIKKTGTILLVFTGLVFGFAFYQHRYWVHYPLESWRWWQTGYKEAISFMKSKENDYPIIAFNNTYEPALPRFLFWWKYPPVNFQKEFKTDKMDKEILTGFSGFSLENKYYFGKTDKEKGGVISFIKQGNILYLVSQRDEVGGDWDWSKSPPDGIEVLKTIRNPYGEPIFYVVTAAAKI